jgi:ribosomal protein S12 methylthiotransferase
VPPKHKVSIITLGCLKNTADTSTLARLLQARGHKVVADAQEADAIVIHTCSFIQAAKKESIHAILQAGKLKTEGKRLIVTGCLVQQHGQEIFKAMPEVDAFLGTGQLAQVADILETPRKRFIDRAKPGGFMDPDAKAIDVRRPTSDDGGRTLDGPTAILRLSEGCRHPCSFCVIPRLRGPVQSRSAETILNEARALAARGVEEFSLIAQDTGDWGHDFLRSSSPAAIGRGRHTSGVRLSSGGSMDSPPVTAGNDGKSRLPALLRSIADVPGVRWIRLMYMHPASFTDELLEVFAEHPDKVPYLDMPLQHIDTQVLAGMKRMTDEKSIRSLIEKIRRKVPTLALRTTFIVGFPGETSAQFKRLVNFIQEGPFDYLGAFAYSKEEGTPAAKSGDQVSEKTKNDRLQILTNAYYDVAHARAQTRIGATEIILLEDAEGDTVVGRTRREAPDIDAIVRLPRSASRPGRFVQATLTGYDSYEFTASEDKPVNHGVRHETPV